MSIPLSENPIVESTKILSEPISTSSIILVLPETWKVPSNDVESKEISYNSLLSTGLYSTLKIDALTVPIPGRVWNIKLPGKSVGFPMPEIFSTRIFLVIKYTLEDGTRVLSCGLMISTSLP